MRKKIYTDMHITVEITIESKDNLHKKRRLVRIATVSFFAAKEYLDANSTAQRNKILEM